MERLFPQTTDTSTATPSVASKNFANAALRLSAILTPEELRSAERAVRPYSELLDTVARKPKRKRLPLLVALFADRTTLACVEACALLGAPRASFRTLEVRFALSTLPDRPTAYDRDQVIARSMAARPTGTARKVVTHVGHVIIPEDVGWRVEYKGVAVEGTKPRTRAEGREIARRNMAAVANAAHTAISAAMRLLPAAKERWSRRIVATWGDWWPIGGAVAAPVILLTGDCAVVVDSRRANAGWTLYASGRSLREARRLDTLDRASAQWKVSADAILLANL